MNRFVSGIEKKVIQDPAHFCRPVTRLKVVLQGQTTVQVCGACGTRGTRGARVLHGTSASMQEIHF